MNQLPLLLELKCWYIVRIGKRRVKAWYMGGSFLSENYKKIKKDDCEVIERIGTAEEIYK